MKHIQAENTTVFYRDDIDHKRFTGYTGIRFGKNVSGGDHAENRFVTPEIIMLNRKFSLQKDSERGDRIAHPINKFPFFNKFFF